MLHEFDLAQPVAISDGSFTWLSQLQTLVEETRRSVSCGYQLVEYFAYYVSCAGKKVAMS